jgi:hypothetical protein
MPKAPKSILSPALAHNLWLPPMFILQLRFQMRSHRTALFIPAQCTQKSDKLGQFLMQQHGLKQGDLTEIGSQGVVSEILSGKRELNIRQIRALSERFRVSPATFV